RPLKQQVTTARDGLEGFYPKVLDRLTVAAVNILDIAILKGDPQVVRMVATAWVNALHSLVSHAGFGEPMLERVLRNRTAELRKRITDPELSESRRFEAAKSLARVGVELLVTAARG